MLFHFSVHLSRATAIILLGLSLQQKYPDNNQRALPSRNVTFGVFPLHGGVDTEHLALHTLRRFQYPPKLTKRPRAPGLPKNLQQTSSFGRFIRIFKQFCLSVSIDIGFVHIVGNVLWPHMPGRLASSRCLAIFRT